MGAVEAVCGFLGIAATQVGTVAGLYLQTRRNHVENGEKLDKLAERFDEHMTAYHRAA